MKFSCAIPLVVSLFVVSCAKPPVTRIRVKVPETFSGYIHLETCISAAQDPAMLVEGSQEGYTPACPPGDVEVVVVKPTKTFVIEPANVRIRRNSEGAPVSISTEIPAQ
jgi:hypothetical protein